jgi:hypothetical protein
METEGSSSCSWPSTRTPDILFYTILPVVFEFIYANTQTEIMKLIRIFSIPKGPTNEIPHFLNTERRNVST